MSLSFKASHAALLLLTSAVAGLFALYSYVNVSGERAWASYHEEVLRRGGNLDLAALNRAPIPDSENFAAIPILRKLASDPALGAATREQPDWKRALALVKEMRSPNLDAEEIKATLAPLENQLNEITIASKRPDAHFGLNYTEGIALKVPYLTYLRDTASLLNLRALVAISAGHGSRAAEEIEAILRIGRHQSREPFDLPLGRFNIDWHSAATTSTLSA